MVYLTKIDASRNMARFYALDLQPTCLAAGRWLRRWGRIGQAGKVRSALHEKREGAAAALERELRRCKRLYGAGKLRGVVGIGTGEPGIFGIGEVIKGLKAIGPLARNEHHRLAVVHDLIRRQQGRPVNCWLVLVLPWPNLKSWFEVLLVWNSTVVCPSISDT